MPIAGRRSVREPQVESERNLLHRLTLLWLALQMFLFWEMKPSLTLELGVTVSPDRMLFIIMLLVFCYYVLIGKIRLLAWDSIDTVLLAFMMYCTISYIFIGGDTPSTVRRWLTTLFNLVYFPLLAYFINKNLAYRERDLLKVLKFFSLVAAYLVLNGVFEHLDLHRLVWPRYILDPTVGIQWGRLRGVFASAVELGGALVVVFASVSALAAVAGPGYRRTLLYGLLLGIAGCIYLTSTRGIWVAFGAVLLLLSAARSPMRRSSSLVLALAALAFFAGWGSKLSFWEGTIFSKRQSTIEYRLDNYQVALEVFASKPLFGVGYGNFGGSFLAKHADKHLKPGDWELTDGNHNLFLGLLAEVGLVGFTCYMTAFGLLAFRLRRYFTSLPDDAVLKRSLVIVAACVVLQYSVMGQSGDLRFHRFLNSAMFVYLGISSGLAVRARDSEDGEGVHS